MELSIWSSYYYPLSPEAAIERLAANGITCTELSDEHGAMLFARDGDPRETGRRFAELIAARGVRIPQGHLPLEARICADDRCMALLFGWIDMYEAIGIRNMVLHCDNLADTTLSVEEKIERNVEKLKILAEYIAGRGITVCLENLRPRWAHQGELIDKSAEDLLHIIGLVGSPDLGICLDTGHLNLTVKGHCGFIRKAGDRLKALHITDNDGVTDQHLMPFNRGSINFPAIVEALREIGYDGIFNLEIPGEAGIPQELRDAKISYIKAAYGYLVKNAK